MSHLRRIFFALLLFLLAGWLYKQWRDQQPGKGLFDVLEEPGEAPETGEQPSSATPVSTLAQLDKEISTLAQRVLPCVVSIDTASVQAKRLPEVVPGLGSGVFISKEGHILTNYHVIAGTAQILISTNNQKLYQAEEVGSNPKADIAVLKVIDANEEFPVLKFGDSGKVKVGQMVFAVGNPFGLSGSFTQGIISAGQRRLSDSPIHLLQTDTVINPGNSGGPLVNIHGEIIGINYSIYRGDERVRAWQGVGLAIPSNDARAAMEAILKQAPHPSPGFLGITVMEKTVPLGNGHFGLTVNEVVLESTAAKAGLQHGDVIVAVNSKPLEHPYEALLVVNSTRVGETIRFDVLRRGQKITITATMQPRPHD